MNAWPPTPSKQRAPLLVKAGWSGRGRKFAAKHAELIFIAKSNPHEIRQGLEEIWTIAEALGRARDDVKSLTVLRIPLTAGDVRERFANVTRVSVSSNPRHPPNPMIPLNLHGQFH